MTRIQNKMYATAAGLMIAMAMMVGCHNAGLAGADKRGEYDLVIHGTPYQVTIAARNVLENEYKYPIGGVAYTDIDGKIAALTPDKKNISIWVDRIDSDSCRMSVTVGTGGDRKLSLDILNKTRAQTKLPAKSDN